MVNISWFFRAGKLASSRMGRRKKSSRPQAVKKPVYKPPKLFPCIYCMFQEGIKITIDKKEMKASLECRKCKVKAENFKVTRLTEPIDIYNSWVDAARSANRKFNQESVRAEEIAEEIESDEPVEYEESKLKRKEEFTSSDSEEMSSD